MSLSEKCNTILGSISSAQRQISAFEGGTKVAATRSRVALSDASKQINLLRKAILEASKASKATPKTKTVKPKLPDAAEPESESKEPESDENLPYPPVLVRQNAITVDESESMEKKPKKKRRSKKP